MNEKLKTFFIGIGILISSIAAFIFGRSTIRNDNSRDYKRITAELERERAAIERERASLKSEREQLERERIDIRRQREIIGRERELNNRDGELLEELARRELAKKS